MQSHETLCLLNASEKEARVRITILFSDRDPVEGYEVSVPSMRTKHVRLNSLDDPEPIPRGKDFASLITSNVPIVVQHSRLDSRQAELALLTTIGYSE